MRIRRRNFGLQLTVLCIAGIVVLARYWYNVGFDQKYRSLIAAELARYGLGAEIGRMTLDPVDGLTARDVHLFDLESPEQHLASINRITLDIDLARLVNREDFLRSITLTRASLSLPVDPRDPSSEWIRVRDLNSRLIIKGQQIEIAQAEADLSGIHLRVRGSITRGPADNEPKDPAEELRKREQQLREMRDRRGALRSVLRLLDRFRIPLNERGAPAAPYMAQIDLEVQGDMADLDKAQVRATLQGGPLQCGDFLAQECSADALLEEGELTLRRLSIRDARGSFSASASWKIRQTRNVDFAVDSSIDLLALLRGVMPDISLPDGLTLEESPQFRAAGQFITGEPFTLERLPLQVTGSLHAGAFAVKGEQFAGLHGDFAVRSDGFIYLRHVNVRHESGALEGQFMRDAAGMRYEFDYDGRMSMLTPLLDLPAVSKALAPVTWNAASRVEARFAGTGDAAGKAWTHNGSLKTRDFQLRGAMVRQFDGRVQVTPATLPCITVHDFLLRREDGDVAGRKAVIDQEKQLLHLEGVTCTAMPAATAGMFAPKTGEALQRYHFENPPRLEVDGTIGLEGPLGNDLKVSLQSPGVCGLPVGGENWRFSGVTGTLHIRRDLVSVDLGGKSTPDQQFTTVRFDAATPMSIKGEFGITKETADRVMNYTVLVDSPQTMKLLLSGREFPISGLDATVKHQDGKLSVNAAGVLFGGRLGAVLEFPDGGRTGRHSATVALDRIEFGRLTALFGSNDETGGLLTGRFNYETPDGRGATIDGAGAATLEEANIFALPLLGPLSTIISALLPGDRIAYSVARQASAAFHATGGTVTMTEFEAATRTFKLTASGDIDIIKDRVDLIARVNLRGAPGLLLYPVSKLFEYGANGSIDQPNWRPRVLNGTFRRGGGEKEDASQKANGKPAAE